jgi:hypothetical protein
VPLEILDPAVAIARSSFFFSAVVSFDDRSPKTTPNLRDLTVGVGVGVGVIDGVAEVVGVAEGVGVLDGLAEGEVVGVTVGVGVLDGVGVGDGDATELSNVKGSVPPVAVLKEPAAPQSPNAGHETELKPAFGLVS